MPTPAAGPCPRPRGASSPATVCGILLAAGALACLGGCRAHPSPDLIAGDGVLCDLTSRLAAGSLRVSCLLGPSDDPHQFQLSPRQSRELGQAQLVLINGYGLTPALARLPNAIPVAEKAVPDSPRLGAGPHHPGSLDSHGRHGHGDRDPHVWHDPRQAAAMVRLVSARLQALLPRGGAAQAQIRQREERMRQELAALQAWNRIQFATLPARAGHRTLATGHRAFTSLSRAYGLEELPVVDGFSNSEILRPQQLSTAVQRLRSKRVPALFSDQAPPPRSLVRLSKLSGVPLAPHPLVADGLAPGGRDGASLMATLVANTCTLSEGLGGRCDRRGGEELRRRWQAIIP